jgi:hypothetical protein
LSEKKIEGGEEEEEGEEAKSKFDTRRLKKSPDSPAPRRAKDLPTVSAVLMIST